MRYVGFRGLTSISKQTATGGERGGAKPKQQFFGQLQGKSAVEVEQ